jgi:ribose 5-phosphate isomerase B
MTSDEPTQFIRRVAVACDHRGSAGKGALLAKLTAMLGKELDCVDDFGCDSKSRGCDYPDFALPVSRLVADGTYDAAILLDGSGIGMSIAANKVQGVRAATCHDEITARIAREHNHCNVLCVGTDLVGEKTLLRLVETFLTSSFSAGRHVRRVAKLADYEAKVFLANAAVRSASAAG